MKASDQTAGNELAPKADGKDARAADASNGGQPSLMHPDRCNARFPSDATGPAAEACDGQRKPHEQAGDTTANLTRAARVELLE